MKKLLILGIFASLLCGCKSNEDKALELIEDRLYKTLYDYESYSPIETEITEAKSLPINNPDVYEGLVAALEILDEISDIEDDLENAKSRMDIWGPPTYYSSSYSDSQYYKYKTEYEEALSMGIIKYSELKSLLLELRHTIDGFDCNKVIGWEVKHRFRCKTKGGQSTIGDYRYVIDKDFTKIILCEDVDQDEYGLVREMVEAIKRGDFGLEAEINAEQSREWLLEVEKQTDVQKTESGLLYRVDREGNDVFATKDTDVVEVNYEGRTRNGEVFDSSYERGESISFTLNHVIRGWTEGMKLIGEGGQITLWIPAELAYGERGAGQDIGPNEALEFKVELVKVNP